MLKCVQTQTHAHTCSRTAAHNRLGYESGWGRRCRPSYGDQPLCPCPGQRVRVEGLSKSPHYNGLFARVEVRLEGGRYRVVLEADGKVLSVNADNLKPIDLVPIDTLRAPPQPTT